MRGKVKRSLDKSVFKRTAVKSKKVNLGIMPMRGGIRF